VVGPRASFVAEIADLNMGLDFGKAAEKMVTAGEKERLIAERAVLAEWVDHSLGGNSTRCYQEVH
jgi:hypothetical protein